MQGHGPATGSLKIPVLTVRPCQTTSRGMPTLTETIRTVCSFGQRGEFASPCLEACRAARLFVTLNAASGEAVWAPSRWLQELGDYTR